MSCIDDNRDVPKSKEILPSSERDLIYSTHLADVIAHDSSCCHTSSTLTDKFCLQVANYLV